ncbi:MAG: hypothetical protein RBT63_02620 [Bdellovibrionales bacterium]|nr:hypothetical protein [Bdellovibrionales bacterium]
MMVKSLYSCEGDVASVEVGGFPVKPIDEASGVALWGESFYVVNDSGDRPRFFRTKLDGSDVEEFRFKDWKPADVEDMSIGPCPAPHAGECLVLADIGDNRERRKSISLAFFRLADIPQSRDVADHRKVKPFETRKFEYPDGAHNAEAFSILSAEHGVIVTKKQDRPSRQSRAASVYLVEFAKKRLTRVGEWDVPAWVKDQGIGGLVTGMSVVRSENGARLRRMLLLTYRDVVELVVDTLPRPWSVESRRVLKVNPLEQQEAIVYNEKGTGFFYTTEAPLAALGFKKASIRHVENMTCR